VASIMCQCHSLIQQGMDAKQFFWMSMSTNGGRSEVQLQINLKILNSQAPQPHMACAGIHREPQCSLIVPPTRWLEVGRLLMKASPSIPVARWDASDW
jgi:hypothetical protein